MTTRQNKSTRSIFITIGFILVLCLLAYLQFRTWRKFDWQVFLDQTRQASKLHIVIAVLVIYAGYFLRALRWEVMLRPVKDVSWLRLLSPMFIGFTGLAVLGRPGEFIRPYLIARRERLPLSSQIAVWTVERIFDMGSFAVLLVIDLIAAPSLRRLERFHELQIGGFLLAALISGVGVATFFLWWNGERFAAWIERLISMFSSRAAKGAAAFTRSFGSALHTIHDLKSLAEVVILSMLLWLSIALAYSQTIHAYPSLRHMSLPYVVLLMAFSVAGSLMQLPVVGGGAQLATIGALVGVFNVSPELALSCGVLLWLVTFVSSTPIGLALARRAHLSIAKLSDEADKTIHPVSA